MIDDESLNIFFMNEPKFLSSYVIGSSRVIFDRVRNKKNNFEITAFLNYERGKSRAGNSKHQMKTIHLMF